MNFNKHPFYSLKTLEKIRKIKQGRFDVCFESKIPYYKKPVEDLCYEEYMLLQLAWADYAKRKNKN
ncbi:hypothetical protein RN92_09880 [Fusobacterium hwasookii ChDC F206]|uniref:Uncharacterized protein n=1 Tax=Fusobacterium hwasookii ChDC F206 TaxID=1307443 RepID=A0AAC8WKY3_9FUSO|nr:hypothetical protein RN92_09880 [Fusobacterium hwasookii ChDC F206]